MPITPQPTDREDGTTIRASHMNDMATAVNDLQDQIDALPPGGYDAYELALQEGFVGTRTEWLDSLKSTETTAVAPNTLAERPSYGTVDPGTLYSATDDAGGTLYAATPSSWTQIAPSVDAAAGGIIASCWPSSVAALTADGAGAVAWPELVTPAFTWPNRMVRVQVARTSMTFTALPAANEVVRLQVDYKIGGGSWRFARFLWANPNEVITVSGGVGTPVNPRLRSGSTSARFPSDIVRIPYPTAIGADVPAPGDSVQVRLSANGFPASHTSIAPSVFSLFGEWVGFDVVAL